MGLYYQAFAECDDCGTVEESNIEWEAGSLPESADEFTCFRHICDGYECKHVCDSCSANYASCDHCEEDRDIEYMIACETSGTLICEDCSDAHHENMEASHNDEYLCVSCEYENPDYDPTPAWVLA